MAFGRNGKVPCGKRTKWLLDEIKVGENEIGRNGKRAGQILGGMGKGRKRNRRNEKNSGEMGMGGMGLGELGIIPLK